MAPYMRIITIIHFVLIVKENCKKVPPIVLSPKSIMSDSKYAERVAAKNPVTLDKRSIGGGLAC